MSTGWAWALAVFGYWVVGQTLWFVLRITESLPERDDDKELAMMACVFWPFAVVSALVLLIVCGPARLVERALKKDAAAAQEGESTK